MKFAMRFGDLPINQPASRNFEHGHGHSARPLGSNLRSSLPMTTLYTL
jgi:hypothetical protein